MYVRTYVPTFVCTDCTEYSTVCNALVLWIGLDGRTRAWKARMLSLSVLCSTMSNAASKVSFGNCSTMQENTHKQHAFTGRGHMKHTHITHHLVFTYLTTMPSTMFLFRDHTRDLHPKQHTSIYIMLPHLAFRMASPGIFLTAFSTSTSSSLCLCHLCSLSRSAAGRNTDH